MGNRDNEVLALYRFHAVVLVPLVNRHSLHKI